MRVNTVWLLPSPVTVWVRVVVVELPVPAATFFDFMEQERILAGYPLENDYPELRNSVLLTVTELNTREEIDQFGARLEKLLLGKQNRSRPEQKSRPPKSEIRT